MSGTFISSLGKFYGRYEDLMKHFEVSLSLKCYMIFWDIVIYSDTLSGSDITPICELITDFDLITKCREISIEHYNWCG